MMKDLDKTISKIMDKSYSKIEELLMNQYPNLYFYISPTGHITCWVRTASGRDGAGINMKYEINVGQILYHHWEYLNKLNEEVEKVHTNPEAYFYCTECGRVLPEEEFEDSVFAGVYCKECAKKPEVAALIAESHTKGFYD